MSNQLKSILLKIARLPKTDQRWIIDQLSKEKKTLFKQINGVQLLHQAQHFRKLKGDISLLIGSGPLNSDLYKRLANHSPLYIAIVLEQGQYDWQNDFIRAFDQDGKIKTLLKTQVKQLKLSPKQALFKQWENTQSLSFDNYMESMNG
ncbi:hypothetical protein [Legionella micdadei]|uniref:Uncharacterized protein n=1 Tax=Legionella micdadei TaxID=451 RepID=A0A098GJF1_LEGMI|nr:hypothetical protein [Legionella micdadei]ARG96962.1 hypothetical protein B6N58_04345 [Legionella micdadei]ARH00783.1 hypothetical protein B6V88_10355 [Legionella micdadei]KTD26672.1 hypothetical protein Lmic_2766 [Legionella micdadei]NSL19477.1 hypothetical protein [Legionella micdadei]CEG61631.1 conserved protein of unknown function [Legionella micdadei]